MTDEDWNRWFKETYDRIMDIYREQSKDLNEKTLADTIDKLVPGEHYIEPCAGSFLVIQKRDDVWIDSMVEEIEAKG